ncbi:DUF4367 domain-containing protein [Clostridium oryzae]|uniref:DUF4367 domain-containing protein n=1 Tax=Clostridium oryzae TaxID=1450648 RepID=A0A1V4IRU3_9CLOT|nr:DUF4367 domain-containing protein [Clostridium oryzae]OPJ62609.1 hypothetical protein CLORY_17390 [Clostridium oryzae]
MNRNSIEENFSSDIDDYLDGIEKIKVSEDEQYNELFRVAKSLANQDFSKNINNDTVYREWLKRINGDKGDNIMKKIKIASKIAAACIVIVVAGTAIMQTPFAKDISDQFEKIIPLGNITVVQDKKPNVDESKQSYPVPDALKGKLFDKDGKEVKELTKENYNNVYTAKGEKIAYFSADGSIMTEAQEKNSRLVTKDINDINKYTEFKAVVPSYLPDGYVFDRAEFYKDEKGKVSGKYIDIHFTNIKTCKDIYIQERLNCKETAYVDGSDAPVEKIKINDLDASLMTLENCINIDWQTDKVLFGMNAHGISADEAKKVAESIPVK